MNGGDSDAKATPSAMKRSVRTSTWPPMKASSQHGVERSRGRAEAYSLFNMACVSAEAKGPVH
jgi:hypothetical protein